MNRRTFLGTASMAATMAMAPAKIIQAMNQQERAAPKICFSTLGCPKWTLVQILDFARKYGYQGIEVRGILGELDLPKSPDFNSEKAIRNSLAALNSRGLVIVGLGSSAELHHADAIKLATNLDNGKRFIDLAAALGGVNVRVYPNNLVPGEEKKQTLDRIIHGMDLLAIHAKGSNVKVLMETHGQVLWSDDLLYIMKGISIAQTGLIWDIYNMWTVTKEDPAQVYSKLKPYIFHTHIKDSIKKEGKENYVLLGRGEAPVKQAVGLLRNDGYTGFYSFEWEKLWHPEIAEPELALADFPDAFKKIWKD